MAMMPAGLSARLIAGCCEEQERETELALRKNVIRGVCRCDPAMLGARALLAPRVSWDFLFKEAPHHGADRSPACRSESRPFRHDYCRLPQRTRHAHKIGIATHSESTMWRSVAWYGTRDYAVHSRGTAA